MTFLLDTNACIRALNGSCAALEARLRIHPPQDIRLSAVTKAELLYGAYRSTRAAENLALLEKFWAPFVSLPFDDRSAREYGRIRSDLSRAGEPIGPNDLLIASVARAHDLTLVTHNLREFSRVPALSLEDWEAG